MKTKNLFDIAFLTFALLSSSVAMTAGTESGGGGDALEARVNDIRADILDWINRGGADHLTFSGSQTLSDYKEGMRKILTPKYVVIGFVEKDDAENDELKVSVNGQPKTCRGFIGRTDGRAHILCNISRFNFTTQADQYRLVHHEYAGLAGLEQNEAEASDYALSSQITDYLKPQIVLKLAVLDPSELERKEDISYFSSFNDNTMVCKFFSGSHKIRDNNLLKSLQRADNTWPIIPTKIPYLQRYQIGSETIFPEFQKNQSDFSMRYNRKSKRLNVAIFEDDKENGLELDMTSLINVKKNQNGTHATYIATTERTTAEIRDYEWGDHTQPEKLVIQLSPGNVHLKYGYRFVGGSSRGSIINFSYGEIKIDCHARYHYKGKEFIENDLTEFWKVVP